jgi:hypothetical protein
MQPPNRLVAFSMEVLSGHRESGFALKDGKMDRLYLSITVSATYTLVAMALIIAFMR